MFHFSVDYCCINTCAQIVSIIHQVQQTDKEKTNFPSKKQTLYKGVNNAKEIQ